MTLHLDTTTFRSSVRAAPFGNSLSGSQIAGLDRLIDAWNRFFPAGDPRWFAYDLATAFHETGGRMQPVRETFASSDAEVVRILDRAYANGQLPWVSTPYWRPDADGKCWYGRGDVQLTHKRNYEVMQPLVLQRFGVDIVADPDAVLRPDISAFILLEGTLRGATNKGDFTGRSLEEYFRPGTEFEDIDAQVAYAVQARRVVNGTDRASLIAGYFRNFYDSIERASDAFANDTRPNGVREADAVPDDVPATRSPGAIAAGGAAAAGPIVSQVVGGINTTAGALVLVAGLAIAAGIFIWLVKTNRVTFLRPKKG